MKIRWKTKAPENEGAMWNCRHCVEMKMPCADEGIVHGGGRTKMKQLKV